MNPDTTNYSRPLLLAASSSGVDEVNLKGRLENSAVVVTADPAAPALATTLRVLIANLRRLPIRLHIVADGGEGSLDSTLLAELEGLVLGIDPTRPLSLSWPDQFTVHVHVGVDTEKAHLSGVADGHGARLRPKGSSFPILLQAGTGLGGLVAGAMLTAEVFKILVGVAPNRRGPLKEIDFCPVALGEPDGVVRLLPTLEGVALIGGGAIGTAVALILRELNAQGELTVVDPETYDEPNVATYSLGGLRSAASKQHKVQLIRDELPGVTVEPFIGKARDYIEAIDAGVSAMPVTVLGAVDSIEARHEIAAIHATNFLDGSTGGATGTMLSLSEGTWSGPCLRCYYPTRRSQEPTVIDVLAERTGLSRERLARGTDHLTADDLDALSVLTAEDRVTLEAHLGQAICGLGRAFGLVGEDAGYNPSAAFVAQQAAALVVGALIRGGVSASPNHVQYDALFGPYAGMTVPRKPRLSCRCQVDAVLHREVRDHRLNLVT
ncbi:ThiF family adenylyltransferase [Oryzobacter telluris]|uniref:ThiF family adenylyltransferase n=1 Tax=Oryzobacter telluris TaxID=3149179 RepID=UPI00370D78A8